MQLGRCAVAAMLAFAGFNSQESLFATEKFPKKRLAQDASDHAARFDMAVCLVHQHDYDRAMDHLFAVMESEPEFREGAVREMIILLSNMLAANAPEQAQGYRRRLASLLNE